MMRPIWYFVGWILMLTGGVVILSGIYNVFFTPPNVSVLKGLHPDLWWGGVLFLIGLLYTLKNKDVRVGP